MKRLLYMMTLAGLLVFGSPVAVAEEAIAKNGETIAENRDSAADTGIRTTFSDVPEGHWAASAVQTAVEKGYVSGYPDGTFRPNQSVTRAEFIRMLADALKLPHSQGGSPWYQPYVAVLLEVGILDKSDFSDYQVPISRLEIMRLVSRGLAQEERYQPYVEAFSGLYNGDLPFTDFREMKEADLPHIALAYGTGIMNGYPDASIGLSKTATRAESVVMIESFLKARIAHPQRMQRLQELKEVAETGTNVHTVSNLELLTEIDPEKIVIEHGLFTARLKRLFVLPLKGDIASIYERKFIWDRELLPEHWFSQHNIEGLVMGVLDLTPKRDFELSPISMPTYLSPGADVLHEEASKRYGYVKTYQYDPKDRQLAKGLTYEVVIGGHYKDNIRIIHEKYLSLKTNGTSNGNFYRLLSNPDAVEAE